MKAIRPLSLLLIFLSLASCFSGSRLNNQNLAHLYQEGDVTIRPIFEAFHLNDSVTQIRFRLESKEMLFMRNERTGMYEAVGTVDFTVYPSYEDLRVIDSASADLYFEKKDNTNEYRLGQVEVKAPFGETYVVEAVVTDYNRNRSFRYILEFDKTNRFNRQNYYITDSLGLQVFPGNQVAQGSKIIVHHESDERRTLHVRYYNRNFPIALPPYSISNQRPFRFKADSMLVWNTNDTLLVPMEGFYHIQQDTNTYYGFSIFAFPHLYPELSKAEELIGPMRYLTTNKEYEDLRSAVNPKKAVDAFWLKIGGTEDRARTLLRTYYKRVEAANTHFTSYLEGWKTDRGMIYTVFGPPNIIYRSSGGESWVYGQESSGLSYTFNFSKVDNPFSDNDYLLSRSTIYRYTWGQAVETWRQGRVYNVNLIRREQDRQFRQNDPTMFWY